MPRNHLFHIQEKTKVLELRFTLSHEIPSAHTTEPRYIPACFTFGQTAKIAVTATCAIEIRTLQLEQLVGSQLAGVAGTELRGGDEHRRPIVERSHREGI